MAQRNRRNALLPQPPLLITESVEEFDALYDKLEREIEPSGIIEDGYVANISCMVWEILRLLRCRTATINAAFRQALENILKHALREPGSFTFDVSEQAETLAAQWFVDEE